MNTITATAGSSSIPKVEDTSRIVSVTTGNFKNDREPTPMEISLASILVYQNQDVVARICHEEKMLVAEAESLFNDVLIFLWLGSAVKEYLVPTPRIDKGWHVFLLFTQDYREFCQNYFGRFIDHHPRRISDVRDNGKLVRASRDLVERLLTQELGLTLSKNWIYTILEKAEASGGVNCCGNCGQGCCKR